MRRLSLLLLASALFVACADPPAAVTDASPEDVVTPPDAVTKDVVNAPDLPVPTDVAPDALAPEDTTPMDVAREDAAVDAPGDVTRDVTVDRDPCSPNPCTQTGRTRCESQGMGTRCLCDLGTHDDGMGRCVPDVRCEPTTCNMHGSCTDTSGALTCACEAGYQGVRCESCAMGYFSDGRGGCTATPCTPNPCVAPDRMRCTVGSMGAVCGCNSGTHDDGMGGCAPDAMCTATTCNGHGTCSMDAAGLRCACATGYAGSRCDGCAMDYHSDGMGGCTMDPCRPSPCTQSRRGVCVATGVTFRCDCEAGYHLEADRCVIDETCTPTRCSGHGTCTVVMGRASCGCAAGYTGASCDTCATGYHSDGRGGCTNDPCTPSPCTMPRRTVCTAMGTTAVCACDSGYHPDGMGGCTNDPCIPDVCAARNMACRNNGGVAECFAPPCNDGNPCTDDMVVSGRCVSTRRADGSTCSTSACLTGERCSAGTCAGGTALRCDDGNPCTRDRCDPTSGCASSNDDTLVPDDTVACTVDRCAAGRASHTATDATCDDGRYCTGVERCVPGDPAANTRGCVTSMVPTPPSPPTACAGYTCDESSRTFIASVRVGATCDDTIACTTGDVCVSSGACVGTATASCTTPATTCGSTSSLGATVNVPSARVTGDFTVGGAALGRTIPSSSVPGYSSSAVYLVARDTGVRHLIAAPSYSSSGSNYILVTNSDRIDASVVPGVYDLLFTHNVTSSGNVGRYPTDPIPSSERVLRAGIIIGTGPNTLSVDVQSARVTGAFTLDGAALGRTVPSSSVPGYSSSAVYLVARDTGVRHLIAAPSYSSSGSNYILVTNSDRIDAHVPPGTYDLLFTHNVTSSGNVGRYPTDPIPSSERILRSGVVLNAGANTLDVDVPSARVTGAFSVGGAALGRTIPSSSVPGYSSSAVYLVARDTGVRHLIAAPSYSSSGSNYILVTNSDRIDAHVPPGTYDLLFTHNVTSAGNVGRYPTDPIPSAERILRAGITITRGANTLDVDVPSARVTGAFSVGGAALGRTIPSSSVPGYSSSAVYLVARDTGVRHLIAAPSYSSSGSNYILVTNSDRIDAHVPPGTYDLLFTHNVTSSGNVGRYPTDPIPSSERILRAGLVLSTGANTLDVDVPTTRLTGAFTVNGMALGRTVPSSSVPGYSSSAVYLVARDTGVRHLIAAPSYSSSGSNYILVTNSDRIDAHVPPGTYDLLFTHNVTSTGNVGRYPTDPIPSSERILRAAVSVSGTAMTLDVNVNSAVLAAALTVNGMALGRTVPSSSVPGYSSSAVYLVARDTGVRHLIAAPSYSSSGSNYILVTNSDRIDAHVPPGTYDLLFTHNVTSTGNVGRYPTDPIPSAERILRACVAVP